MIYALLLAGLLVLLQQVQGTAFAFSVLCAMFLLVATLTFNLAGGLTRPTGGYVFFYSVLGVLVGLVGKALLGERADAGLLQPTVTMGVFFGGICGMLVAVYVSKRLTRRRAFLQNVVPPDRMQDATIGCMVVGVGIYFLLAVGGYQSGSLLSALGQINRFLPLSIILGVTHQIRKSGGTSSINGPVLVSSLVMFVFYGVFSFSKEGMLTPLLCWAVAAGAQRYRVTLAQIVGFGVATTFFVYYMVPYAQDGRNYRSETGTLSENIAVSIDLLQHLDLVRDRFKASEAFSATQETSSYFAQSAFLDRLQMISVDDRLIDVTERGDVFGLTPVLVDFENLIPHVFWPNKPTPFYGNAFAHEIGGLSEDDTTTGVSFSPSGEAYHLDKWVGVLLVAPLIWILLFVTMDSLCGDVRRSPWGLLVIALFAHTAPEGMLDGAIYTLGYGSLSVIFGALASAYVMPLLGKLLTGSRTAWDAQRVVVRPLPKRVAVVEAGEGATG